MNLEFPQVLNDSAAMYSDTSEGLISDHFEKLFVLFNTYIEDYQQAIALTEEAFKSTEFSAEPSSLALYGWAAQRIQMEANNALSDHGLSSRSMMCFLLKELGELRYGQIADILGFDGDDVKQRIASVRKKLINELA